MHHHPTDPTPYTIGTIIRIWRWGQDKQGAKGEDKQGSARPGPWAHPRRTMGSNRVFHLYCTQKQILHKNAQGRLPQEQFPHRKAVQGKSSNQTFKNKLLQQGGLPTVESSMALSMNNTDCVLIHHSINTIFSLPFFLIFVCPLSSLVLMLLTLVVSFFYSLLLNCPLRSLRHSRSRSGTQQYGLR